MVIVIHTRRLSVCLATSISQLFFLAPHVAIETDIDSCFVVKDLLTEVPLSIIAETATRRGRQHKGDLLNETC